MGEWLPVRHARCGGIAYELDRDQIDRDVVLNAKMVRYPSGRQAVEGDLLLCDGCGENVGAPVEHAPELLSRGEGTAY